MISNLNELVHFAIVLFVVSIPFYPVWAIRYLIFVPVAIALGWVVFDGCPISIMNAKSGGSSNFTWGILRKVFPSISESRSDNVVFFSYIAIVFACYLRVVYQKR